jgi:hypothetical protein
MSKLPLEKPFGRLAFDTSNRFAAGFPTDSLPFKATIPAIRAKLAGAE